MLFFHCVLSLFYYFGLFNLCVPYYCRLIVTSPVCIQRICGMYCMYQWCDIVCFHSTATKKLPMPTNLDRGSAFTAVCPFVSLSVRKISHKVSIDFTGFFWSGGARVREELIFEMDLKRIPICSFSLTLRDRAILWIYANIQKYW